MRFYTRANQPGRVVFIVECASMEAAKEGLLGSPKKFTTLVSSQTISLAWRFPPITGAEAPHYKKGLTTFWERSSRSISRDGLDLWR